MLPIFISKSFWSPPPSFKKILLVCTSPEKQKYTPPGAAGQHYPAQVDIFVFMYSLMQSDWNNFSGDVVLDSFNKASRDEDKNFTKYIKANM